MSKPLVINVSESLEELKKYIRSAKTDTQKKRLRITTMDEVRQFIDNQTKLLSDSIVKSTCFRKWFFPCNYWTVL